MANKSENADIREMQTQMIEVREALKEVRENIKLLLTKFDEQSDLHMEIEYLKTEVSDLKRRRSFISYAVPILVSIATAVMTFLSISFFNNVGKVTPTTNTTTTTSQTTEK